MPAPHHHGHNDDFGDDGKFAAERSVDVGVAKGEPDGAVRGDDLEEAGE